MIIFLFCFLYLVFDTYIMWFLHSNKRWLSESFSLLSRYELFFIEHFLFCLNVFVFIWLPIFVLILIILIMIIFVIIVFVIVITIIISSFSMLVISLVFTILFYLYLCIYRIFFKFQTNDVTEHCSKLAVKTLRLYQCLWWELWIMFA